jgi:hypothetical protein
MSMVALLQAVRHRLRDALTLKDSECDIGTDGQPHARAGERFLMVHPGPITNGQTECIDEYYSVKVTITRRLTYAPADRAEQPLVVLTGSLYELAAQARAPVQPGGHGQRIHRAAGVQVHGRSDGKGAGLVLGRRRGRAGTVGRGAGDDIRRMPSRADHREYELMCRSHASHMPAVWVFAAIRPMI